MKKYLKLSLFILSLVLSTSFAFADDGWDGDDTPPTPGDQEQQGDGTQTTPIDNYLPILIITAVTIAGIYSYKERKLIQK